MLEKPLITNNVNSIIESLRSMNELDTVNNLLIEQMKVIKEDPKKQIPIANSMSELADKVIKTCKVKVDAANVIIKSFQKI